MSIFIPVNKVQVSKNGNSPLKEHYRCEQLLEEGRVKAPTYTSLYSIVCLWSVSFLQSPSCIWCSRKSQCGLQLQPPCPMLLFYTFSEFIGYLKVRVTQKDSLLWLHATSYYTHPPYTWLLSRKLNVRSSAFRLPRLSNFYSVCILLFVVENKTMDIMLVP